MKDIVYLQQLADLQTRYSKNNILLDLLSNQKEIDKLLKENEKLVKEFDVKKAKYINNCVKKEKT